MKTAARIWLAAMLLTALTLAPGGSRATAQPAGGLQNETGNSSGNLINRGHACSSGGWVFYGCSSGLFKTKPGLNRSVKLADDPAQFINAAGDWIYYTGGDDAGAGRIYRIARTGERKTLISRDYGFCLTVFGGWIYYTDGQHDPEGWRLCRVKTNGSGKAVLRNRVGCFFSLVGGWLYYTTDGMTHRMSTDGVEDTVLETQHDVTVVTSDGMYYIGGEDGDYRGVYREGLDGTGVSPIVEDRIVSLNVADGWVYYARYDPARKTYRGVYRVRPDGTGKTRISKDEAFELNIAGPWIYYVHPEGFNGWVMYRLRTDGTEKTLL